MRRGRGCFGRALPCGGSCEAELDGHGLDGPGPERGGIDDLRAKASEELDHGGAGRAEPPNKGLQPTSHPGAHRAAPGARPGAPRLKPRAFGGRTWCQAGPGGRRQAPRGSWSRLPSREPRRGFGPGAPPITGRSFFSKYGDASSQVVRLPHHGERFPWVARPSPVSISRPGPARGAGTGEVPPRCVDHCLDRGRQPGSISDMAGGTQPRTRDGLAPASTWKSAEVYGRRLPRRLCI